MPTLARSTAIRRMIYGRLASAGTITSALGAAAAGYSQNIYNDLAPESAGFPYIIIGKQSAVPIGEGYGTPGDGFSQLENDLYMVKVVDINTSADTAEMVAGRIYSLLNDWAPGTASLNAGTVQYLRRESDIAFTEQDSGQIYRHAGSLYRVMHAYGTASP